MQPPDAPSDKLFVVPINPFIPCPEGKPPHYLWPEGSPPFAVVVTAHSGSDIQNKPFPCIAAFEGSDGKYDLADGVFGVGVDSIVITVDCPWPELCKALQVPPRSYSPLLKTSKNEPPYLRVKNWAEDKARPENLDPDAEGSAVRAFRILSHWNRWHGESRVDWRDRVKDVYDPSIVAGKLGTWMDSKADVLRHECAKIGLKPGQMTDFEMPSRNLFDSLAVARTSFQGMKKK